jgi:hypothetical protein
VTPAGKNAGNKGLIAAQNGGKKYFQDLKMAENNMIQPVQVMIIKYLNKNRFCHADKVRDSKINHVKERRRDFCLSYKRTNQKVKENKGKRKEKQRFLNKKKICGSVFELKSFEKEQNCSKGAYYKKPNICF